MRFSLNLGMIERDMSKTSFSHNSGLSANQNAIKSSTESEVAEEIALETLTTEGWSLVLYNDEHNTFDHVIDMLISICEHDAMQAEQCALMVHFKGKCSVMSGTYDELEPKCSKLLHADLTAEIEA
tara:strand:- start:1768 stop:2145 length:378 start_codon:yes stop_codon:yes gene_type:complete